MRNHIRNALKRVCGSLGLDAVVTELECLRVKANIETRIAAGFAKAGATSGLRKIDPCKPITWEFSGFSQHGEDGIVEMLISRSTEQDRFFLEIGAADGLENCTAWLALARGYSGVMVEGQSHLAEICRQAYAGRVYKLHVLQKYVTLADVTKIVGLLPSRTIDFLSLDIDSTDFHILKAILEQGLRPKIICVEYNSAFGPDFVGTVPYKESFSRWTEHPSGLYYGVSLAAWKMLLKGINYRFITVESSGTNAFFVNPSYFKTDWINAIKGISFLDNSGDCNPSVVTTGLDGRLLKMNKPDWVQQFELIKHLEFYIPTS